MLINFLGDSITEGAGATDFLKSYSVVASSILGTEYNNYGISGTRIAKQFSVSEDPRFDLDFNSRVHELDKNADMVVIFGGTNDFSHGDAPFGLETDTTCDTFCGACTQLFSYIRKEFANKKVLVILPLHREYEKLEHCSNKISGEKHSLREYGLAMERHAKEFGFEILDLWDIKELNPNLPEGKASFDDGLHPNDKGARILGEYVAQKIKSMIE